MNLPKDYQSKMQEMLGEEYLQYLDSFNHSYGQTLRVNQLKMEPADFIRRFLLSGQVSWCNTGFYYEGEQKLSAHPYYYAGVYYLQEPSAMAPAAFLPVEPGDRVLDLCAAPGGKSTALAAKLQGEGMFRREPSMVKSWSLEEVDRYAELQREILCHAAQMVKPGGYLLYSTCTFAREEDEQTVEYFLEQNADFSLQELPICDGIEEGRPEWTVSGREDVKNCRRFLPYKVRGEGHFAALFKKREEADCLDEVFEKADRKQIVKEQAISKEKIPDAMEEFMRDIPEWKQWKKRLFFIKERAFLLPEHCPDLRGLRIVRSGLYLGDCLKKRFEPSQALAMALHPSGYKRSISFPAEDIRVEKYLRGETVDMDDSELSGWTLFCVDEFPLGWGKCNRGRLKNKYNPGWRKL